MEWFISLLEKLGVKPEALLIIVLMSFLIIWLYKQISTYMSKTRDEEKIQIEKMMVSYSTLYKACLRYKNGEITKGEILQFLVDTIQYTDKKIFIDLEDKILLNESLDSSINEVREIIFGLKEQIDICTPLKSKETVGEKITSKIRLVEEIFSPVLFTFLVFAGLLTALFIYFFLLLGKFSTFFLCLIIFWLASYILSLVAAIIDKTFKLSLNGIGMLVVFFVSIGILIWFNNVYTLISANIIFFIFVTFSPKYLRK